MLQSPQEGHSDGTGTSREFWSATKIQPCCSFADLGLSLDDPPRSDVQNSSACCNGRDRPAKRWEAPILCTKFHHLHIIRMILEFHHVIVCDRTYRYCRLTAFGSWEEISVIIILYSSSSSSSFRSSGGPSSYSNISWVTVRLEMLCICMYDRGVWECCECWLWHALECDYGDTCFVLLDDGTVCWVVTLFPSSVHFWIFWKWDSINSLWEKCWRVVSRLTDWLTHICSLIIIASIQF